MGVFDEGMLFYEKRQPKQQSKFIEMEKQEQEQAPSVFDGAFEFFGIELEKPKPKQKKKLKIPTINVKDSV